MNSSVSFMDFADFIAGCIGGGLGVVVGHPFDTIKVRLQVDTASSIRYKGLVDCLLKTVQLESATALLKGVTSPLSGLMLINAIIFGVQGNVKRLLPDNNRGYWCDFLSGSAAGFVQTFVCCPMELAKLRLQAQNASLSPTTISRNKARTLQSPIDAIKHSVKTEGIRGPYRGFWITALRETPSFGLYFVVYESICDFCVLKNKTQHATLPVMIFAGGCAGVACWGSIYPLDVIKTRYQNDGTAGPKLYKSSVDCLFKTVKEHGTGILTRGMLTTLIRAFPVNAVTLTTVTCLMRIWRPATATSTHSEHIAESHFN